MKLRQALKVYNRVDTPRERPWKQNTIGAALRRYQKTATSKDADVLWDSLMRARRRQIAAPCEWHRDWEPDDDGPSCQDCGRLLAISQCEGCGECFLDFRGQGYDDVVAAPAVTSSGDLVCVRCVRNYDDAEDEGGDYDYRDDEDDEWDDAMDECGMLPDELGGGCTMAGSEHCEFDCPMRRSLDADIEAEIESTTNDGQADT